MSSGTESPPLEATGEHKPMGAGSVNAVAEGKQSGGDVQAVSDRDQRGGALCRGIFFGWDCADALELWVVYFDNAENAKGTADQTGEKMKKD